MHTIKGFCGSCKGTLEQHPSTKQSQTTAQTYDCLVPIRFTPVEFSNPAVVVDNETKEFWHDYCARQLRERANPLYGALPPLPGILAAPAATEAWVDNTQYAWGAAAAADDYSSPHAAGERGLALAAATNHQRAAAAHHVYAEIDDDYTQPGAEIRNPLYLGPSQILEESITETDVDAPLSHRRSLPGYTLYSPGATDTDFYHPFSAEHPAEAVPMDPRHNVVIRQRFPLWAKVMIAAGGVAIVVVSAALGAVLSRKSGGSSDSSLASAPGLINSTSTTRLPLTTLGSSSTPIYVSSSPMASSSSSSTATLTTRTGTQTVTFAPSTAVTNNPASTTSTTTRITSSVTTATATTITALNATLTTIGMNATNTTLPTATTVATAVTTSFTTTATKSQNASLATTTAPISTVPIVTSTSWLTSTLTTLSTTLFGSTTPSPTTIVAVPTSTTVTSTIRKTTQSQRPGGGGRRAVTPGPENNALCKRYESAAAEVCQRLLYGFLQVNQYAADHGSKLSQDVINTMTSRVSDKVSMAIAQQRPYDMRQLLEGVFRDDRIAGYNRNANYNRLVPTFYGIAPQVQSMKMIEALRVFFNITKT
jgi:hypothetical protein